MGELLSDTEKRNALERILESRTFEKSGRARDLLSYIVEQDLAGNAEAIKGFSIAMDVFGKDENFDPVSDPLVRVQAGRLRDYLTDYYAGEGKDEPLVINVPRGGYRPVYAMRRISGKPATGGSPATASAEGASGGVASSAPPAGAETLPAGRINSRSGVARQIRLLWLAFCILFALLIAIAAAYWFELVGSRNLSSDVPDLPRIRVLVEGDSPEISGSAERISSILTGFDTVINQPVMSLSIDSDDAATDWSALDYGLKITELPSASVDGPKRFITDIIHLQSGDLFRSETYSTSFWGSPEEELITASKMSGLVLPGRVIYADVLAREAETPYISCLRQVRTYYIERNADTHRQALSCSEPLQTDNQVGGLMRAMYGGLLAEGAGRKYDHAILEGSPEETMRKALRTALSGVDLAPSSARAAREVGFVHSWLGQSARMRDWFKRANELNPNDTSVAASYGYGLVLSGDYRSAARVFNTATRATTRHPTWWDFYYSLALLMENRIDEAKRAAEPLAASGKNLFYSILNASLAFEKGERYRAAYEARQIRERYPKFARDPENSYFGRTLPKEMVDRLLGDLRNSGL